MQELLGLDSLLLSPSIHWEVAVLALKSLALGAFFAVVSWAVRQASASTKHRLWVAFFAILLLLPVLSRIVPPALDALTTRGAAITGSTEPGINSIHGSAIPVEAEPLTTQPSWRDGAHTLLPFLTALWLAVALALTFRMGLGLRQLRQVRNRSARITDERLTQILDAVREQLGISRPVELRAGPRNQMPVAWGVLRTVVLLPEESKGWDDELWRIVLLHELAHVKRHDLFIQALASFACALHWFNPVCWLGLRHLLHEAERACDDAVLRKGISPSSYAQHLLSVVRDLRTHRPLAGAGVASMAGGRARELDHRISAILDPDRPREPAPRRRQLGAAAVLAAAVLSTAAFSPTPGLLGDTVGNAETPDSTAAVAQDEAQPVLVEARIVESPLDLVDWRAATAAAQGKGLPLRTDLQIAGPQATLDQNLRALSEQGQLEILAAPTMLTLSGEPASVQSGQQMPVETVVDGQVTVQYINATLRLDLEPRVRNDGNIEISVSVQKRYPAERTPDLATGNSPIQTNEARSRVLVRDGGTAVLSGAPGAGDSQPTLVVFLTARLVEL